MTPQPLAISANARVLAARGRMPSAWQRPSESRRHPERIAQAPDFLAAFAR
jgi:hypothetical protein